MNPISEHDLPRWSAAEEGQFFERKSALDRSGAGPKPRKAAAIAHDIAETLVAFANADGGELVVGMENDGSVSGVPHAEDKVRLLLGVPKDRNYLWPSVPCRAHKVDAPDGKILLRFEADWSPNVHLLADSRCLRRVQDQNAPFDKDQVRALKEAKAQGLFERTFPAGARMEDLDETLLTRFAAAEGSGPVYRSSLMRYRLTEGRNGDAVPTLAALLLFGRDPGRWHERAGLDFVRWEGKERKSGSDLNIAKRFRIEAPLSVLPDKAFEAIKPFIRERQYLHDLFFVEKLEYPTFAWQEAVVNAVAHTSTERQRHKRRCATFPSRRQKYGSTVPCRMGCRRMAYIVREKGLGSLLSAWQTPIASVSHCTRLSGGWCNGSGDWCNETGIASLKCPPTTSWTTEP